MELLNLKQGTDEWLATRLNHFTASEAPIMMGVSPHMSRDELLSYKKTTIQEEVDYFTQLVYDKGHELEDKARPFAEKILGDQLFPVTGRTEIDGINYLASCDGLEMLETFGFEHKQWNEEKAQSIKENGLSPEHYWQLEHQLLVTGAKFIFFVMSDGDPDSKWIDVEYRSVPERREKLIAGWKQFSIDLENHVPKHYAPKPEGKVIDKLPALSIQLVGEVKNSNLDVYQETALAFINNIKTELTTDQDFADAEKTIKFCEKSEKELDLVKDQALSQTEDISKLFNTVDTLKQAMRSKRLDLGKIVKAQKDKIRADIVVAAREQLLNHITELNQSLGVVSLPAIEADFNAAIKGKKTVKSLEEAANNELAAAKIRANENFELIQSNLTVLEEKAADFRFLFNDLPQVILKSVDDFKMRIDFRI